MSDFAAEEIRGLKAEVARLTNALNEKNASFCTHCKTLFPRGREGFEQFKKHIPDCPSHPLAATSQQKRHIFNLAKRVHARAVAAESERDRLKSLIRQSCDDHIALAKQYEAGGNTRGARHLRATGNLLGVIWQGGTPTTIYPPAASTVQVTDDDGEAS